MSDATAPVVVIGDALIDELREGDSVAELVGGAALNVAVGLVRLGVPATLIAMVGDDEAGAHIRAYLADYGVGLLSTPSQLGSSRAVSTRTGGEPVYEFNAAARARRIVFGDAERAAIAGAPLVAVSCYPFDDEVQAQALADAVGTRPLVVDPNPRSGMLADREAFVWGFEALVPRCTLVKVGDDDAELLYGMPLDAVRQRLAGLGAGAVLATAGADGAALQVGDVVLTAEVALLPGPVVDTMGAGDAVTAAMAAALVSDRNSATSDSAAGGAGVGAQREASVWQRDLERAMQIAAATVRMTGGLLQLPEAAGGMDLNRLST